MIVPDDPGVCPTCRRGNHLDHTPGLGGICIGCTCPVVTTFCPGPPECGVVLDHWHVVVTPEET